MAQLHRRIRNIRQDFLHKLTTKPAKTKSVIVLEDLNVNGMIRNRRLARHIGEAGFTEMKRMLGYKTIWYGSNLTLADRWFPSSRRCSKCGHELEELALSVREWDCPSCGTHHDRDVNAAQNLAALAG